MIKQRFVQGLGILAFLLLLGLGVFLFVPSSGQPRYSPDGRHYFEVSSRPYHRFLPAFPGQGSDKPGFITVFTAEGKRCGRAALPMVWMSSDFRWEEKRARVPLVAEWDLEACRITKR